MIEANGFLPLKLVPVRPMPTNAGNAGSHQVPPPNANACAGGTSVLATTILTNHPFPCKHRRLDVLQFECSRRAPADVSLADIGPADVGLVDASPHLPTSTGGFLLI